MIDEKPYTVKVLSDKKRLQEIYELRVKAWEASRSSNIINRSKYPEGFMDEFDNDSLHLIATYFDSEKIMSACRVTFFPNKDKYPYIGLEKYDDFPTNNFALISRGVRNINFKHKKLQYDFVSLSLDICRENGIEYATGHAYNENIYMQNLMLDLGFKFICDVKTENYRNEAMGFPGKLFVIKLND